MDKRKLVNIILKDLEEVRTLSEEIAESEDASLIEIELALNRAKLLIHEIEFLRELAGGPTFVREKENEEKEQPEQDELEEDIHYPEPELEITNFKEDEFQQDEVLPAEEEADLSEEPEEDLQQQEDSELEWEEDPEEADEEDDFSEEDLEEEDWDEDEEDQLEEEKEEPDFEEVKPQAAAKNLDSEVKSGSQAGFREIHIDEDDDIQPIRVSNTTNTKPPMREIPKPEDVIVENHDKEVLGEKFHKERSLNETLGENKGMESKLTSGPITSLKSAIGLNDRFLFIREIFNNNSAKYNEVIDNLDKMSQIQEAVEYLRANLTMQKNEASIKFVELLKRRFNK